MGGLTSVLGSGVGRMQSMLLLRRLLPRLCGTCEKKGVHLLSQFVVKKRGCCFPKNLASM